MTPPRTRVVLVEEDRAVCQRVERVLLRAGHALLVAMCGNAEQALARLVDEQLRADVALINVGQSGIDLIRRLTAERPDLVTIAIVPADEDPSVLAAINEGASGYLVPTDDPAALRDRLVVLLYGGAPITPVLASRVLESRDSLTPSEVATLERLATGAAPQPADPSVVRGVYRKLGASSRSDLVRELYRRRQTTE